MPSAFPVNPGFPVSPPLPVYLCLPSKQCLHCFLGVEVSPGLRGPSAPSEPRVLHSTSRRLWQNRAVYTQQKQNLEKSFKDCPYLTSEEDLAMAERIDVKDIQDQV